jgi:hypothetical protein
MLAFSVPPGYRRRAIQFSVWTGGSHGLSLR